MGRKKCKACKACKNGPNTTIWLTDQCDTQEMARHQQDQHLKYDHSQPQDFTINVPDYFPSDVSLESEHTIEYLHSSTT